MTVRIGDRGVATTVLRPGGFVTVAGTRHRARSQSGFIEATTEIVVVSGDNLGLLVRELRSLATPEELPGHGEVVHASFGDKFAVTGKAAEVKLAELRRQAIARSWICGGTCGFCCSVFAAYLLAFADESIFGERSLFIAGLILVIGSVWGLLVGRCLCAAFDQIENHPDLRLTYAATIMTLVATTAAVITITPRRGVWVGLATALSTTVIVGAALPAVALVGEWVSGSTSDGFTESDAGGEIESE